MEPPHWRDRQLAKRIAAGDDLAFRELYTLYAGRVRAFATSRLGDASEAEDAAQDVFLAVHRCIGSYAGRSSLATWILGIARYEVLGRLRRRRRTPSSVGTIPFATLVTDDVPSDRQIDASRALATCAQVLERQISPAQREIFDLYYGSTDPTRTIAAKLGRSHPSVKMSLSRTRRVMKERLGGR